MPIGGRPATVYPVSRDVRGHAKFAAKGRVSGHAWPQSCASGYTYRLRSCARCLFQMRRSGFYPLGFVGAARLRQRRPTEISSGSARATITRTVRSAMRGLRSLPLRTRISDFGIVRSRPAGRIVSFGSGREYRASVKIVAGTQIGRGQLPWREYSAARRAVAAPAAPNQSSQGQPQGKLKQRTEVRCNAVKPGEQASTK